MVSLTSHLSLRRAALIGGSAVAMGGIFAVSTHVPAVSADTQADRDAAARVRAAVAAEGKKIGNTAAGLRDAEARLAKYTAREAQRRQEFLDAQDKLVMARVRLTRLQHRSEQAKDTLGETLAAAYRRGNPDLASTVIDANGLKDAVQAVEFEARVHQQNANALKATRSARKEATAEEKTFAGQEKKFQALAKAAAADRDAANNVRQALLERQARQLAAQNGAKAKLRTLQARIRRAELAQIAATRASVNAAANTTDAPRITGTSDQDAVVAKVVAAANQIASTPYVWGGGHGGASGGYDCSGSISYAFAAAGLITSPMVSGSFASWGLPGPGQRITVYANAGHVYMYVDGRRYDTSALSSGGTRWTTAARSNAGFVARHPPGL